MSTQVQFRRGSTAALNAFTGAIAEMTVDTQLNQVRLHDGVTAGGRVIGDPATVTISTLAGGTPVPVALGDPLLLAILKLQAQVNAIITPTDANYRIVFPDIQIWDEGLNNWVILTSYNRAISGV